jgi:hypothetical protein
MGMGVVRCMMQELLDIKSFNKNQQDLKQIINGNWGTLLILLESP